MYARTGRRPAARPAGSAGRRACRAARRGGVLAHGAERNRVVWFRKQYPAGYHGAAALHGATRGAYGNPAATPRQRESAMRSGMRRRAVAMAAVCAAALVNKQGP
jgi:hypothetical protein